MRRSQINYFKKPNKPNRAGLHPPKGVKENKTGQGRRREGPGSAHTAASCIQHPVPGASSGDGRDSHKGLQKAGDHQPCSP